MTFPTVRLNDRGPVVADLQVGLIRKAQSETRDCLGRAFPRGRSFTADGDFGLMTRQAVRAFQTMMQATQPDFGVDGVVGSQTWAALGVTAPSRRAHEGPSPPPAADAPRPGGRLPGSGGIAAGPNYVAPPEGTAMPAWMIHAWHENTLNTRERGGGDANNPHILKYLAVSPGVRGSTMDQDGRNQRRIMAMADAWDARNGGGTTRRDSFVGKRMSEIDETPWCGCFVQWCLLEAGHARRPNLAAARGWIPRGSEACLPRYGAVCVVEHATGGHHVGFWVGPPARGTGATLLGGNQNDRVCVKSYDTEVAVHYMWPGLAA